MKPFVRHPLRFTVLAAALILVTALPAAAKPPCSDATLEGDYSATITGFGPGGLPFAALNLGTSDGAGNFVSTGTSVFNGVVSTGNNTGTYSINSDCVGTLQLNSPPSTQTFIVLRDGSEARLIRTDNAAFVLTGIAKRVD